jgi:hypothetical protein
MKKITTILYFILLLGAVYMPAMGQRPAVVPRYTVPHAQVQPAWVFPIWIEDSTGAKDTLYHCYDPTASDNMSDIAMGEICVPMKQGMNIEYGGCTINQKHNTLVNAYFPGRAGTHISNMTPPFIIRFDHRTLYDSILPYYNASNKNIPSAMGVFNFGGTPPISPNIFGPCNDHFPILLTDTSTYFCYFKDSIVCPSYMSIGLGFQEWSSVWLSNAQELGKVQIPKIEKTLSGLLIDFDNQAQATTSTAQLFGLLGQVETPMFTKSMGSTQLLLPVKSALPSGIYILKITQHNQVFNLKINY